MHLSDGITLDLICSFWQHYDSAVLHLIVSIKNLNAFKYSSGLELACFLAAALAKLQFKYIMWNWLSFQRGL